MAAAATGEAYHEMQPTFVNRGVSPGVTIFILMLRGVAAPNVNVSDLSSNTDAEMDMETVNAVKTIWIHNVVTPRLKLFSLCSFRNI